MHSTPSELTLKPVAMACRQIINVEAGSSKRGGRAAATVTAHLGERGDLWASMGKRVEDASYANPYTVEYKMAYTAEGWRITHTLVLGDA